jgi:glycosyltransferase involved in cell wall biosynthesis
MRVLAITNNLRQASFRLRVEALVVGLLARGVELDVRVRPRRILARRKLLRSAGKYDAVLLQRKMLDPVDARVLRRAAGKIFFDVDDAVMFHNRPVGVVDRWRTKRRFIATAKNVDLVVAGNRYLAEIFRSRGCKTVVLPTVVDPSHYVVKKHGVTGSPGLVWIGSKSTLPYLKLAIPAIAAAALRVPGLRLITVADQTLGNCPVPMEHIPWSVEAEAAALARGDIGIAPTPEDRWTLGKCGFKIVQYMAAGLPVIASPVGANADIVVNGVTGVLCDDVEGWTEGIVKLAEDVKLRAAMGAEGRKRVEESYSVERAVEQWGALFNTNG